MPPAVLVYHYSVKTLVLYASADVHNSDKAKAEAKGNEYIEIVEQIEMKRTNIIDYLCVCECVKREMTFRTMENYWKLNVFPSIECNRSA